MMLAASFKQIAGYEHHLWGVFYDGARYYGGHWEVGSGKHEGVWKETEQAAEEACLRLIRPFIGLVKEPDLEAQIRGLEG